MALAALQQSRDVCAGKSFPGGSAEFIREVEPLLAGRPDFQPGLDALDVARHESEALADRHRPLALEPRQARGEERQDALLALEREFPFSVRLGKSECAQPFKRGLFARAVAQEFCKRRAGRVERYAALPVDCLDACGEEIQRALEVRGKLRDRKFLRQAWCARHDVALDFKESAEHRKFARCKPVCRIRGNVDRALQHREVGRGQARRDRREFSIVQPPRGIFREQQRALGRDVRHAQRAVVRAPDVQRVASPLPFDLRRLRLAESHARVSFEHAEQRGELRAREHRHRGQFSIRDRAQVHREPHVRLARAEAPGLVERAERLALAGGFDFTHDHHGFFLPRCGKIRRQDHMQRGFGAVCVGGKIRIACRCGRCAFAAASCSHGWRRGFTLCSITRRRFRLFQAADHRHTDRERMRADQPAPAARGTGAGVLHVRPRTHVQPRAKLTIRTAHAACEQRRLVRSLGHFSRIIHRARLLHGLPSSGFHQDFFSKLQKRLRVES